jgi:hypothetical protein
MLSRESSMFPKNWLVFIDVWHNVIFSNISNCSDKLLFEQFLVLVLPDYISLKPNNTSAIKTIKPILEYIKSIDYSLCKKYLLVKLFFNI